MTKKQEKLLVVLISIYLFFIGVHRGGTQLVINDIADLFGTGTGDVGIFTSIQSIPPLFGPLCAGIIADRIGKKPVVTAFIFMFAIGCGICGFSGTRMAFIIGIFIFAMGSTVSEMMSTATLSDVNVEKSVQYINISQFMFSMGAVVGPLMVQFFSENAGADWRFPFSFGFLSFVIMGVLLMLVKFPAVIKKEPDKGSEKDFKENTAGRKSGKAVDFSFVTPVLACLGIGMLVYIGMEHGYGNFIDSVMQAKLVTGTVSALTLSAFWLGMALCRLAFGLFSNYKPGLMLKVCFLLCTVFLVILTLLPGSMLSVVISFLIGAAYGPIWCTIEAIAAAKSGGNSGKAIGLMSICSGIGGIVLPTAIGKLANVVKVENSLLVLAAAAFIGVIASLKIKD